MNMLTVKNFLGRASLVLGKRSPEILLGLGIAGVIGTAIATHKAARKIDGVLEESNTSIAKIKSERADFPDVYILEEYQRDLAIAYTQRAISITKVYWPAVVAGSLTVACFAGSHSVLNKRNIGLMSAYSLIEASYAKYRAHVVDEFGAEKDLAFRHGFAQETITETVVDEEGKKTKVKKTVNTTTGEEPSDYAKYFDSSSNAWQQNPELNLYFLKSVQSHANDILKVRGHLFLNEVYDMLGLPRTSAGAVVGWIADSEGDNFVDFNIYDVANEPSRDFVNGYNKSILLDFNVDGVIYNLI